MRIKKIEISCFRSVKKATIEFDGLLAIVGENNSGKSAVLRVANDPVDTSAINAYTYEKKVLL